MLTRYRSIFIISFLWSTLLSAQHFQHQHRHQHGKNLGSISGTVTADSTNNVLPGVNLLIKDTNIGAASGPDGTFLITGIPAGQYTLRATMMGYDILETSVDVQAQSDLNLNLKMSESIIEMNEIVVTGTGMPQLYSEATVKTAVVNRDIMIRQKVNNLAEAIDFQPGIRVEGNCQNCNFTQVRMLGLEGHHSQILIDSDPVISSLAGVYGLEQLPQEMIERVEIVKGGGSSLYGGQAVAGVVNLITRRPSHNDFSFDYNNGSIGNSRDHRIGGTISRINESGTSKGVLFGNMRQRDPYDHNGDGFSEIGQLKSTAVGFNYFYDPVQSGELSVQTHYIHEDRRGGNKFDVAPHNADIAEWVETFRYGGSLAWTHRLTPLFDYKAYTSFALTNRNSYYGAGQDPYAYGKTENPLFVSGIRSNYLWGRHAIVTGIQFSQDAVQDRAVAYNRVIDETYSDIGLIFQDTYKIGVWEKSELVYGLRFDKHSALDNTIASPRIALKSNLSGSFILRGGYSSGFKAPQVFDEDLHITQVGGEGVVIRNSAHLKEERGHTLYGGIEYTDIIDVIGLKLSLNGFYTRLTDTFILTEGDQLDTDQHEFYRINGPGSRVQGAEIEFGLRMQRGELLSGFTIQSSLLDEPEPDFGSTFIFRTPDVYGSLRFSYDFTNRFNMLLAGKYTGSMHVPHYAGYIENDLLVTTKSFATLDLIASYKISFGGDFVGTFTAGVYNITNDYQNDFDSGMYRDAGYVYGPLIPRRLLLGFTIGHNH